jgi:glycosyltransferase involved in cell wall biosynthesis
VTLTQIGSGLFGISVWLLAAGWLWQLIQWIRHSPEIIDITRVVDGHLPTSDDGTIQLTVIVAACNEEESIAATLRSLLASEGIRLQIIAVNDRSTDLTGEIMEQVVAQTLNQTLEHRIQTIHIKELPCGWLGKPHALAAAAGLAQSDWLLFTDGDVRFAPQAVSLALRHAMSQQADHLVLMPDWILGSHGEKAMLGAMHALSTWTLHLWRIADPDARDSLGVGAFNLVRRRVYEALGGFEALRMEVAEDLWLGRMVKRAGYRQRVVFGRGLVAVRWSVGALGVVRNLEKNLFAFYRFSVALALLASLGLAVQISWPILAVVTGGWTRVAGSMVFGTIAGLYLASRKVTRVPAGYVLVYPLATSLLLFAILRSMTLTLLRGGVVWRGTLYSLKELRAFAGRFRW